MMLTSKLLNAADTELVPVCWSDKHGHKVSNKGSPCISAATDAGSAESLASPQTVSQDGLLTSAVGVAARADTENGQPGSRAPSSSASSPTGERRQQQRLQHGVSSLPATGPEDAAFDSVPLTSAVGAAPSADRQAPKPEPQSKQQPQPWYRSWEVC